MYAVVVVFVDGLLLVYLSAYTQKLVLVRWPCNQLRFDIVDLLPVSRFLVVVVHILVGADSVVVVHADVGHELVLVFLDVVAVFVVVLKVVGMHVIVAVNAVHYFVMLSDSLVDHLKTFAVVES